MLLVTAGAGIPRQMDCSPISTLLWRAGHRLPLLISTAAVGQPDPGWFHPQNSHFQRADTVILTYSCTEIYRWSLGWEDKQQSRKMRAIVRWQIMAEGLKHAAPLWVDLWPCSSPRFPPFTCSTHSSCSFQQEPPVSCSHGRKGP